jgi:16S rRNA processing protein RimM
VRAIHDFGAGDVIEVAGDTELMLPFTRGAVPTVDLAAGRIVTDLAEVQGG